MTEIGAGAQGDPLVIRQLEFMGGMASVGGWRPEPTLPEVAFAGRSNVGKSSLINRLLHRKKMARVSNTPGRTREINFFRVNDQFVLVDLPGYGYARISKEKRAEWRPLIESYLRTSPTLRGIVQLLDVRHEPTNDDLQMLDFLGQLGVPTIIAISPARSISQMACRMNRTRSPPSVFSMLMYRVSLLNFQAMCRNREKCAIYASLETGSIPCTGEPAGSLERRCCL